MRRRTVVVGLVCVAALCALAARPWFTRTTAVAPSLDPRTLLIVAPPVLEHAAAEWAAYRTASGWHVARLSTVDSAGATLSAEALRDRIAVAARAAIERETAHDSPRVALLLLGDVPSGKGPNAFAGIPTFHFDQPDPRLVDKKGPRFVSDHPYQRLDSGELPDLALGRVPARSDEQALSMLAKIRRYEEFSLGASSALDDSWRSRLSFVASEGRFGAGDAILEGLFRTMIDDMVPARFALTMTYASPTSIYCPPPSRLEETIVGRFAEPALLVNYLGHGFAEGLDRMRWGAKRAPLFTMKSMASLAEPRATLPIAFLGCCSTGWYDLDDGRPSFGEALLAAPGGPIAVIAGSRLTHPYATAILQKDVARLLLDRAIDTIGELDLLATRGMLQRDSDDAAIDTIARPIASLMSWPCSLDELRLMHVRMYNLLGDPATRIAHPAPAPERLELAAGQLIVEVTGMTRGSLRLVLETARDSCVDGPLVPALLSDDPDLESRAIANYAKANERILLSTTTEMTGSRIEVALPDPLPSGAAILRVVIDGVDENGGRVRRLGGIRLEAPVP